MNRIKEWKEILSREIPIPFWFYGLLALMSLALLRLVLDLFLVCLEPGEPVATKRCRA